MQTRLLEMDESNLTRVFEMLVERLSNVECILKQAERQRLLDAENAPAGKELDGSLFHWNNTIICKRYSGRIGDDVFISASLLSEDVLWIIVQEWAKQDEQAWLDVSLKLALGDDAASDLKRRIKDRFREIDELEIDWTILCKDIKGAERLGGTPEEEIEFPLIRSAMKQRSNGLIVDVNATGITIKHQIPYGDRHLMTCLEESVLLAKDAFGVLIKHPNNTVLLVDVFEKDPFI